jgi:hypothetical protein
VAVQAASAAVKQVLVLEWQNWVLAQAVVPHVQLLSVAVAPSVAAQAAIAAVKQVLVPE